MQFGATFGPVAVAAGQWREVRGSPQPALDTASVARPLRENTGRPPPWPASPTRTRRFDLIAASGSSATVAGAALLGRLVEHKVWGLAAAAAVLITLTVGAALANNSRRASSSPSQAAYQEK
ncbi:hypothetical protein GFS60_07174 (plasmid) [Rhodococcus sp. WAY2]|nr:hypothetical protein GFS60_07174 [Rhodococcus sp. WAY2]